MIPQCVRAPAYSAGLTLTERVAAWRRSQSPRPPGEADRDRAARRLRDWKSQPHFATGPSFARRLAAEGLTEDELLAVLGGPIEGGDDPPSPPPPWSEELERALADPPPDGPAIPLPEALREHATAGFLVAAEPLLARARGRLRTGIRALASGRGDLPFDPATVEAILLDDLPASLRWMLDRTLVLELHVARLQGLLPGDTPAGRFQGFLRHLRRPQVVRALFHEYPVLARQLITALEHFVDASLSFLGRLCADREAIRAAFSPGTDPGVLVEVAGGVGDKHRGGQSVLIATFDSGLRVVYKPKALGVDVHVQELLAWLNARGDHPPFRTMTVLDRGRYGWVEFVAAGACASADEVRRFYERQGGYLALLYALEATDFHGENLIAAGEHPVLVDLESLFHPRAGDADLTGPDHPAVRAMADSVLRVGLLPQRLRGDDDSAGVDLSGLGADDGQLTPCGAPAWEATGTDRMRFTRRRQPIPGARNRPTLGGARVEVADYAEAIARGFASVYRLLCEHREELLSDEGPLARFAHDEVRVILRSTRIYASLLSESFHPDLLRDALERDRWFDRLWATVEHRPSLARVVAAERADLLNGDIPMFTTRPASRDLWAGAGAPIADYLDETGMSLVRRRVLRLGERDLAQQLWFIRAALATLPSEAGRVPDRAPPPAEPETCADRGRLLAAARAVGDELEALALRDEHGASWIGLDPGPRGHWTLTPMGADLYGGLAGQALFLAYLGAVTEETRYTRLAREASTALRRRVERDRSSARSIGGFDGWGGIIYALAHLGALWGEPAPLAEAEAIVGLLPDLIESDERFDIIGGSAGCIGGLLGLQRIAPSDRTLAAAIRCGDRLLARARPMPRGIGWLPKGRGTRPLAGFAHGAAGIAWALLELAARSGEGRFRAAAHAAIAYERTLFSAEASNWLDLREREDAQFAGGRPSPCMTAWCHGAPGIGLARLRSLPHLDDATTRAEIGTALATTLAEGFGQGHSLCHGDLGNLDFVVQAAETLGDPRWPAQASRRAALILEGIDREGWLCGVPMWVESPGLMTGLAGIGYGLLRLAAPTRVPSVLVLEPPMLRV